MMHMVAPFAVLATAPPPLNSNFYTGALATDSKVSGPHFDVQDGVCCPVHSLADYKPCNVQTQQHGGDTYEQGTKQRTRTDSAEGSVVTWFGSVMKQMFVVTSSGTKHKYDCAAMCPLAANSTWHPTVMIGGVRDGDSDPFSFTKPRHLASPGVFRQPAAVGGVSKRLDRWEWIEKVSIIPMAFITAYVSHETTPARIFGIAKRLIPFQAWENISFVGFQPEASLNKSLDEYFDIDPETIAKCPRIKSGCLTPPSPPPPPLEAEVSFSSLLVRAVRDGSSSVVAAPEESKDRKPDPPLPNVTFEPDWTATIEELTIIDQGGTAQANGDLCCSYGAVGAPPACAVSVAKTSGVRYFDVTNQRFRFEAANNTPGAAIVVDYKAHRHMVVAYKNGTTVIECKQYCPVSPHDVLKPHFFGFHNEVSDEGPAMWHGIQAQHYHWVEKASPLPIALATYDFYADISDPTHAKPLGQKKALTPFGSPSVGFFNTTWTDFKAGAPDPTLFVVTGIATCPKSPDCGKGPKQDERLKLGLYHTYRAYAEGSEP